MRHVLALILLLPASSAFSQTTSICLPLVKAARVRDSLQVLPVVRQEAAAWRLAAQHYQASADSGKVALLSQWGATRALNAALQEQQALTDNETAKVELWKQRARRRGLLNWLGLAVLTGATYLYITH